MNHLQGFFVQFQFLNIFIQSRTVYRKCSKRQSKEIPSFATSREEISKLEKFDASKLKFSRSSYDSIVFAERNNKW